MNKYMISGVMMLLILGLAGCMDLPNTRDYSEGPITLTPVVLASGGVLEVDSSVGDVIVRGTDKEEVSVTYTKYVQIHDYVGHRENDPEYFFDRMSVELTQSNSGSLGIVSKIDNDRSGEGSARIELVIEVPNRLALAIRSDVGKVNVKDVSGDLEISSDVGDVTLDLPTPTRRDSFVVSVDVGDTDIILPADAAFSVNASTDIGDITVTDFPSLLVTEDITEEECRGDVNGGGPRITASTDTGNITIRSR